MQVPVSAILPRAVRTDRLLTIPAKYHAWNGYLAGSQARLSATEIAWLPPREYQGAPKPEVNVHSCNIHITGGYGGD